MNNPVLNILAVDTPSCPCNINEETGFQAELFVAIGCRVMLIHNTWVEGGLADGTLGTVRAIVYNENKTSIECPDYVMVQFDNYKGSCINGNLFPVKTIARNCEKNGRKFTRKRFPLKLAYAITIHKSQGLTLELIVIDIGDSEFAAGLTYVVLTRVRRITDLVFIIYKNKKQFDKIGGSITAKLRIEFLKRLHLKATRNTI